MIMKMVDSGFSHYFDGLLYANGFNEIKFVQWWLMWTQRIIYKKIH